MQKHKTVAEENLLFRGNPIQKLKSGIHYSTSLQFYFTTIFPYLILPDKHPWQHSGCLVGQIGLAYLVGKV